MVKKEDLQKMIEDGTIRGFLSPEASTKKIYIQNMGNYTGIVLHEPEKAGTPEPVFNFDSAYEIVKDSQDEIEACQCIANMMSEFIKRAPEIDMDFSGLYDLVQDFDKIKDRLYLSAVSPYYNNDNIQVYREYDMSFIPKALLATNRDTSATIPVSDDLIERMGVSKNDVIEYARNNTKNVLKPVITDMQSVLKSKEVAYIPGMSDLLVVTAENRTGSASLALDKEIMDKVAEKYNGNNFFVLPSSIHEVLTLPVGYMAYETSEDIEFLTQMVEEINDTTVSPDERLSYTIYHYDSINHKLEKATDYCINKQLGLNENNKLYGAEDIDMNYNYKNDIKKM